MVRSTFRRTLHARKMHVHTRLCSPEQRDREEARHREATFGPAQETHRRNQCRAYRVRGKAKLSLIEETWEETLPIPPPGVVPYQAPDGGLKRHARLHINKEERNELARCQAWTPAKKASGSVSGSCWVARR